MQEWINQIDRRLSKLRDEEAKIYYQADAGGELDMDALTNCAERRRRLLQSPNMETMIQRQREVADSPADKRICDLLLAQWRLTQLDDEPSVSRLRSEIERTLYEFQPQIDGENISFSVMGGILKTSNDATKRKAAHLSMKPFLEKVAPQCRDFLRAANQAARNLGMSNYVEAKLASQDLDVPSFQRICEHLRNQWLLVWRSFVAEEESRHSITLQPWDVLFLLGQRIREAEQGIVFPKDVERTITETFSLFGLDLSSLPIRLEFRPIPHIGAVHTLKVGSDIRVVMREGTSFTGFDGWNTLFHEIGHAIYYCYAPRDSALLLDNRIGRESLAELFACLIETPEWFTKFVDCSLEQAQKLLQVRRQASIIKTFGYLRETLFEIELFLDPEKDFETTWERVTGEILGVSDTSGVYSDFLGTYPMDIKDYVYARWLADNMTTKLRDESDEKLLSPNTMNQIIQRYYGQWNLEPWHVRFPKVSFD